VSTTIEQYDIRQAIDPLIQNYIFQSLMSKITTALKLFRRSIFSFANIAMSLFWHVEDLQLSENLSINCSKNNEPKKTESIFVLEKDQRTLNCLVRNEILENQPNVQVKPKDQVRILIFSKRIICCYFIFIRGTNARRHTISHIQVADLNVFCGDEDDEVRKKL